MKRAKEMNKLHKQVRAQIEKMNKQYKATHLEFKLEDLVWLHLKKERFLSRRKSKFMARGDGP